MINVLAFSPPQSTNSFSRDEDLFGNSFFAAKLSIHDREGWHMQLATKKKRRYMICRKNHIEVKKKTNSYKTRKAQNAELGTTFNHCGLLNISFQKEFRLYLGYTWSFFCYFVYIWWRIWLFSVMSKSFCHS